MTRSERTFEDKPAVRTKVPLLVGIMGPSGGGKTYSALRLATGMTKVCGGEIFVVDTESKRALHYADNFKFRHIDFGAPFSPLDYLEVLQHCSKKGASTVIVDSMSHEHEGPGGVLEWQSQEVERLSGGDPQKAERVKMLAWSAPKQARRRLINTVLQLDMNVIFCFRAKDKVKVERGQQPASMGWMPIGGDEFLYEMVVNFLLPPASNGVPQWKQLTPDQEMFLKAPPRQFADLLRDTRSIDEAIGESMAKWAMGDSPAGPRRSVNGDLAALSAQLIANGLKTAEDRIAWCRDTVGRAFEKVAEMTPDEVSTCMQAAKEMAA